eukprot:2392085-Amphidinium_carterae.2
MSMHPMKAHTSRTRSMTGRRSAGGCCAASWRRLLHQPGQSGCLTSRVMLAACPPTETNNIKSQN